MRTSDVEHSGPRRQPTPERSALIRAEQLRAQYANLPSAFIGGALTASLVVVILWGKLDTGVLLSWLAAAYINCVSRIALWRWFRHVQPEIAQIARWGRYITASSGIAGGVWGVGSMLLHVPGALSSQLFVLLVTTGMSFTSTYLSAPYLPAFLAFAVPTFILSAVAFLRDGDVLHVAIGLMVIALLLPVVRYAIHLSKSFLASIDVRLRNIDLVEELRSQKRAAEEANIAKSRFLAVASHDLRQPLQALGLFVQALQESALPTHEQQLVNNVRRSVDAMEELFDALLDVSRLDAGAVRPCVETFPVASLLERLRFEYAAVAEKKGLAFRVAETAAFVRTDPTLLARIVRNLVANAVRYTDRGAILLGCRRAGPQLRIEVWDTGCGVPTDRMQEIFQEFTQLDNPERDRRKGLGLGLAIVERLARLLGHEIRVRSRLDTGSVFSITVPRGRAADYQEVNPVAEFASAFDLSGLLVVVLEKDPVIRQGMEALLVRWNCKVASAASGSRVLEELRRMQCAPDLIVSEVRLADSESGLSAIQLLRGEFNADIPALLVTGDTGLEGVRQSEVNGFHVLHKPVNPGRLRTLIANLLRQPVSRARLRTRRAGS